MAFNAELESVTRGAMERLSVPGVAVGIVSPDGRETFTFGITALDTQFAVRPDTLFQVGSVSKPFTATMVVALSEAGKLDLDTPVIEYLPELRLQSQEAAERITLRHLLSHQGGFWGDWFDDFGLGDNAIERFVAEYHALPQMFEPGTLWAYNNCGYILAGLAAATVSDLTFEDAVREYILDPLSMDHTVLSAVEAIAFPVAVGHTNDPEDGSARIARQFLRPRARNPAGGLLSSVEDVLTFAELHLGKHDGVISNSAINAMREPQAETFEAGARWGLGFKIKAYDGGEVVGHGGATNGFRALLSMVPERQFAVTVLTNSDSGNRLAGEVVDWVLEARLGLKPLKLDTAELAETDRERFAGYYAQPYASLDVQRSDDGLRARQTTHSPYSEQSEPHTGPWFGLRFNGDDRFVITDGELEGSQVKFWTREDGSVRYLQAGGRLYVPESWEALERSRQ